MNEYKYNAVSARQKQKEIAFQFVGTVIAVAGAFITVLQYTSEQRSILEREYDLIMKNDTVNFRQAMSSKKIEVYTELVDVVGAIIVSAEYEDKISFAKSAKSFERVFYGKRFLIDDKPLDSVLNIFQITLKQYQQRIATVDELKAHGGLVVLVSRESIKRYEY